MSTNTKMWEKDLMNFEHRWKLRDWFYFSSNPSIFELDYDFFDRRMNIIRQELMEKTWHPDRFRDWCLSIDELKELV